VLRVDFRCHINPPRLHRIAAPKVILRIRPVFIIGNLTLSLRIMVNPIPEAAPIIMPVVRPFITPFPLAK
jgi:hypothetical protein